MGRVIAVANQKGGSRLNNNSGKFRNWTCKRREKGAAC